MKLNPTMVTLFALGILAASACARDKHRGGAADREGSSAESALRPALWEPADNTFKGCEGAWGARLVGRSADVIPQPDAKPGQRTYCPVSGVVFQPSSSSARRQVDGRPIYFCCEACAGYFVEHRERIIELRHLSK